MISKKWPSCLNSCEATQNSSSPWITLQLLPCRISWITLTEKLMIPGLMTSGWNIVKYANRFKTISCLKKYDHAIISNLRNPKSMWKWIKELVRKKKHISSLKCNIRTFTLNQFSGRLCRKYQSSLDIANSNGKIHPPSILSNFISLRRTVWETTFKHYIQIVVIIYWK